MDEGAGLGRGASCGSGGCDVVSADAGGRVAAVAQDRDHRPADRTGGIRDGDAVSYGAYAAGRVAQAVSAVGVVVERCVECAGIGGGAGVRDLFWVAADAADQNK